VFECDLYRFLDFAATNATSADTDPPRRAVDQGPDGLQIWSKYPSRSVIGMADIIAGGMMLPAHLADPGHSSAPCKCWNRQASYHTGV
jgi:hypothetical protein